MSSRSAHILNFARKALVNQLTTNANRNLVCWKRSQCPNSLLCGNVKPQTNKHVFSNCDSSVALSHYRARHDAILMLLASWLQSVLGPTQAVYADLGAVNFRSVRDLFKIFGPYNAVVDVPSIHTWELTACHETNFTSSKQYQQNTYRLLDDDKTSFAGNRSVTSHTVEVSTLGIVSDTKVFTSATKLLDVPASLCQTFQLHCGIL